jgi:hypothetical protein
MRLSSIRRIARPFDTLCIYFDFHRTWAVYDFRTCIRWGESNFEKFSVIVLRTLFLLICTVSSGNSNQKTSRLLFWFCFGNCLLSSVASPMIKFCGVCPNLATSTILNKKSNKISVASLCGIAKWSSMAELDLTSLLPYFHAFRKVS